MFFAYSLTFVPEIAFPETSFRGIIVSFTPKFGRDFSTPLGFAHTMSHEMAGHGGKPHFHSYDHSADRGIEPDNGPPHLSKTGGSNDQSSQHHRWRGDGAPN